MATETKEAFKRWLSVIDINYDALEPDKRVSYKAQYDQAHPSFPQGKTKLHYEYLCFVTIRLIISIFHLAPVSVPAAGSQGKFLRCVLFDLLDECL
jgi:hypothetical protein